MRNNDLKILHHIRNNARTNLTTISRKTGIPVSTIFDRLKSHQGNMIRKFTALLDFTQLGYPIRAKLLLRTTAQDRQRLGHYLMAHPQVNSVWRINNGFDLAAECFFKSIGDAEEFIEEIELKHNILEKSTHHIIEDLALEKAYTETALP